MKPCCRKPRLYPVGTTQCNPAETPGFAAIEWFQCLNCRKQVSRIITQIEDRPPPQTARLIEEHRPMSGPKCCRVEMEWRGIESESRGAIAVTFDEWVCRVCTRQLRVPRLAPAEGIDD